MHPKILAAFEEIDADIFNGDSIADDIGMAQTYFRRWIDRMPALAHDIQVQNGPAKPAITFRTREERDAAEKLLNDAVAYSARRQR